jgi:GH24 family phage-related lysozyme (muramidase)
MAKETYKQFLKRNLAGMIDRLDLDEFRKDALKARWLDQLLWLESSAAKAKSRFYTLRLITIVGGVITPALVSLNHGQPKIREVFTWTAFGMAQAVAISAAVEELFGFNIRYRTFRNTAEGLKVEGWQYFQLTGHYNRFHSHSGAYVEFAGRVEGLIQQDIEGYLAHVQQADDASRQAREQAKEMAATTTAITVERLNQILEDREKERQLAPPPPPQEVTSTPQAEPELVSVTSTVTVKDTNGNGQPKVDLSIWENVIDLPTDAKPQPKPQTQNGSTNGNPTGRKMNAAGMRILKECEGLYLNSYKCPAGVWTIGYGCTKGIRPGMTISEAEAEEMLRKELTEFEKGVERILSHIPLNENQFSALVSLTYNCGMEPITEGMTIRRKLEARDYRGAAEGFLLWNKGGGRVLPGLVKRREMEKKLFLTEV